MTELEQLETMALTILTSISQESNKMWKSNSKFIKYRRDLEIDKRGSFGERFVTVTLQSSGKGRYFEYRDGNQGDWDLKFNKKKYEVKTSSLDVNNKFQNEGLKKDVDLDGVIFIGVAPDQLYIKCVKYNEIPFEKLHDRSKAKTGVGYKWDFKRNEMIPIEKITDVWDNFEKVFIDI